MLRSPEGHVDPVAPPAPAEPSLVNEPLVDPNAPVVDPNAPPVDPNAPPKPAEPPAEPVAVEPLTVEALTLPEGYELQPEMAKEFLEILNGETEPKDRANALLALHAKTVSEASEASSQAYEKMQTEWRDAAKADPDIGGAKLQPALTNIGKLLDEFGSPDLKGVFDFTGAGNNVHMIKFLNKVAEKLTEGGYQPGGSPSKTDDSDAARASRMYPSMPN